MQYRPEAKELLSAIQDLLMKEVLPKLEGEDLLSYKTLVSWNMLGVIARELDKSEEQAFIEFESFSKIKSVLKDFKLSPGEFRSLSQKEKIEKLSSWNSELSSYLRTSKESSVKSEVWEQIKSVLKNNLAVSNPRYNA
ncbi:DUF6285 domain-containing protein [Leptospira idonii]|uniref:DUF6285 domain-containing protein n=1 Tax=Leptospira idonii TaxID=1193500 RepID=A0A4R9LVM5_9LEPT|nr:DUF6285 domain-containing protein [Leptospira idonii]TGN17063.1 hypothetical protein EHS15_17930 [Leptospira idonii]